MDDGDHEGSTTALHTDTRFLVATTLATLVVAGSTYIWRSNPRRLLGNLHQRGQEAVNHGELPQKEAPGAVTLTIDDDLGSQADSKDLKSSRSKERRRRGKDPLKELLKGGKKARVITKPSKPAEVDGDGGDQSNILPPIQESTNSRHLRKLSFTTSSRSVSTASTSNRRTPPPNPDWAGPYTNSEQGTHEGDDADGTTSSIPTVSTTLVATSSQNLPVPDSDTPDHFLHPDPGTYPRSPDLSNMCLSTSSSTSHSSSIFSSNLAISRSTSPTLSTSDKTPTPVHLGSPSEPSRRRSAKPITTSTDVPSVHKDPGPPAFSTASSSSTSDKKNQRPPRLRSKSRGSGSLPMSPPTPASNVITPIDTEASSLSPSNPHDDGSHPFTFATLNSPGSNSSPRPQNSATSNGNGITNAGSVYPNGITSKRAPTPRRPPTPLSGTNTPPPSLSTQTQLASLRGALEASRLREEKTKSEIERYSKDIEMMRWEGLTWKRREMELQHQIQYLVHQLQAYATLTTSMSGQPPPASHRSPNNINGTESLSPQNGFQFTPSHGPHSPTLQLQIPQMFLANGIPNILSPMSMGNSSTLPFYPYSPHSPHPHQHAHSHVQLQPTQPSHQQSNLLSTLFPQGAGMSESEPSSVTGSSSPGSRSPDVAGSPTPSPALLNRGRRRTRTQTQTADGLIGERVGTEEGGGDSGDGWIGIGGEEATDGLHETSAERENSDDDDYESGFSEALADAILKRPGSIRGLSSKKGKVAEHTEFTFPSLSDMGIVSRGHSWSVEVPPSDDKEDENTEVVTEEVDETTIETTPLTGAEAQVEEFQHDA